MTFHHPITSKLLRPQRGLRQLAIHIRCLATSATGMFPTAIRVLGIGSAGRLPVMIGSVQSATARNLIN